MMRTKLIIERFSRHGVLLEKREQMSRSFVKQFLQLLQSRFDQGDVSIQDITDTAKTNDYNTYGGLKVASGTGHAREVANLAGHDKVIEAEKVGIQVGTGNTAAAPDDYALETRIVHGQDAGELAYGGTELLEIVVSAPSAEFTIRRYFTNDSGDTITIEEVGIYALIAGGTAYAACAARDVVSPGVAVADGEILKVTYVPSITV